MKTAECEGIEAAGALLARACAARVESVEPIAGSHNVKAVVDAGRYGRKTVVCGAPNCRAGMITAYVPLGKKVIHGVESDGMLASAAELGINRDHAGIIELEAQSARRSPAACPTASSRSTTSPSRTARTCGATTAWRAKWPPSSGSKLQRSGRARRCCPTGRPPIDIEIEDLDLCPRYSALVFENVTRAAVAAVAAIPAHRHRPQPHQQHRRHDQLHHGRAGAAHARLRRATCSQGDTIFIRPRQARRALPRAERRGLHAGPLQPGDRRCGGRHRAGRRDRRHATAPSARRPRAWCWRAPTSRRRRIRKTSSAIKLRTDASMRFEKAQDPANTVRGLARALELLREISPGIRLVGGLADQKQDIPAPPPIELAARLAGAQAGPRRRARRSARASWNAWSSASPSRAAASSP